jgi:uncharacterized membrane protein
MSIIFKKTKILALFVWLIELKLKTLIKYYLEYSCSDSDLSVTSSSLSVSTASLSDDDLENLKLVFKTLLHYYIK